MPDKAVIDSSVIAAIFFKEEASEKAENAARNHRLITLDLAVAEVANVAWKRIMHFNESSAVATKALKMSIDFIFGACEVIALKELYQAAFEIAIKDKITVYDALFVAASERENAPLLTTDGKLYEKIKKNRNVKQI